MDGNEMGYGMGPGWAWAGLIAALIKYLRNYEGSYL